MTNATFSAFLEVPNKIFEYEKDEGRDQNNGVK